MASPAGFVEGGNQILGVLPIEIANSILLSIKVIGGLFIAYLIFLLIRFYYQRRQVKAIEEIRKDVKEIKKKLKIK